ncbi:7-carboxy-7-deazaguanine synthase QueE [bacterium]|nr:MAG: 7-carboxy-7-deazaguanine synthase QueE [bacterium]
MLGPEVTSRCHTEGIVSDRLRISEIFSSVQGEGIWMGIPSVFVRVSGCNLRCAWCDTPYASWHPEGPVRDVSTIADAVLATGIRHAVLTGGEPMLFDGIAELASRLRAGGMTITVETAGTIHREMACDLMSISPKLSHSTPNDPAWGPRHEALRLQPAALSRLIGEYDHQLKFVIATDSDLDEIDALLAQLPPVLPERILLMPEGRDATALWARMRSLVPLAMARGWRLAPRMQIDLFGDTKGT